MRVFCETKPLISAVVIASEEMMTPNKMIKIKSLGINLLGFWLIIERGLGETTTFLWGVFFYFFFQTICFFVCVP